MEHETNSVAPTRKWTSVYANTSIVATHLSHTDASAIVAVKVCMKTVHALVSFALTSIAIALLWNAASDTSIGLRLSVITALRLCCHHQPSIVAVDTGAKGIRCSVVSV